jgi:hypothetical protein
MSKQMGGFCNIRLAYLYKSTALTILTCTMKHDKYNWISCHWTSFSGDCKTNEIISNMCTISIHNYLHLSLIFCTTQCKVCSLMLNTVAKISCSTSQIMCILNMLHMSHSDHHDFLSNNSIWVAVNYLLMYRCKVMYTAIQGELLLCCRWDDKIVLYNDFHW